MLNIINDQGNANKNHNPIPVRNAITQKTKISQSWQTEKREILYTIGKHINGHGHYGKQYRESLKK